MSQRMKLTKEDKIAVIQRGMARLPAMGEEAKWAFGVPAEPGFVALPPWVRRLVLLSFDVDPDRPKTKGAGDPLGTSKMLGALVGFAESADIVLRASSTAEARSLKVIDEEQLKSSIAAAAGPHLAQFSQVFGIVRQQVGQKTAEQYAAFTAGQSEAAQIIAAEEKEPGSTSNLTHDLYVFLWIFWRELPLTGSAQRLHQWITDLGFIHCSEKLVEKVCAKAQLRLSKRGRTPRIPT